jgi:hypothetical protein
MNVLVACEESQVVCKAFRARGHEAYSCDIISCSGGHPDWHIQDDILNLFDDYSEKDETGWWDLMIAHPPCTYLANSGVSHLFNYRGKSLPAWEVFGLTGFTEKGDRYKTVNIERWIDMRKAAKFFADILLADIPKICVENPIMHKYAFQFIISFLPFEKINYGKYDQIIHPWQFGHMEQKPTCLWLKGLPKLTETNNVKEEMLKLPTNKRQRIHYMAPSATRQKERSVTYQGIADAMAEQWGELRQAGEQK